VIRRLLVVLALVMALMWALGRILVALRGGAGAARPSGRRPDLTPDAADGRMVRDRNCNTFLPRASAVRAEVDGEEQFFCSERCRDAWLAHR